jgi:hypothetical protein
VDLAVVVAEIVLAVAAVRLDKALLEALEV